MTVETLEDLIFAALQHTLKSSGDEVTGWDEATESIMKLVKRHLRNEISLAFEAGELEGVYRAAVLVNGTIPKRTDNTVDRETYLKKYNV